MKAEHRKELETNSLASKFDGFIQSVKEGPTRNATIYGTVIVLVIAVILVYRWVSANAITADSGRWLSWNRITSREELEAFAKGNADTEQGRLARFGLARLDLVEGLRNLGSTTRTEALKRVRQAAEAYEKLAGESGNTPQLSQEALLNAAKARESLGEIDRAKELYGRLAHDFPQSLKGKEASEQIKALDTSGPVLEALKILTRDPASELPDKPAPLQ